jgi:hypothetical protein
MFLESKRTEEGHKDVGGDFPGNRKAEDDSDGSSGGERSFV